MSVFAHPYAEVFLRGRSLGVTPLHSISVASGEVELELLNTELALRRKVTVSVQPGGETVVRENLVRPAK